MCFSFKGDRIFDQRILFPVDPAYHHLSHMSTGEEECPRKFWDLDILKTTHQKTSVRECVQRGLFRLCGYRRYRNNRIS